MLISANIKDNMMVVCEIQEDQSCINVKQLLSDESITSRYPNLVLTSSSLEVPFLSDITAIDFTEVISLMLTHIDTITESILEQIKDALYDTTHLEVSAYKEILECLKVLLSYLDGNEKVIIEFPMEHYENYQVTKRLVDSINQKSGIFRVKDNVTKFRATPDDELYIYVPRPDALQYTENMYDLIPPMEDIFVPYKNPILGTYEYKNYLAKYGHVIEDVTGDPNNNTKDILPEEKRYYDSLCALLESCLKVEYPNQTLEECKECKVVSNAFREYITALIVAVVSYHWNHSGYMPLDMVWANDSDEDDDDVSEVGDSVSADVSYSAAKKADSDGLDIIEDLVRNQFRKDIYAPINMLIQCLRFGNKKPSKLTLASDKQFFDLNHFVYSSTSGSYDSYTLKTTASGCNYSIVSIIKASNRIMDNNFLRDNGIFKAAVDCPIGLLVKKSFQDTDDVQFMVLSIVDLITWIGKDPNLTIEGVNVNNGLVSIDPSRVDESIITIDLTASIQTIDDRLRMSSNAGFISYTSEYLKDAYFSANSFNNSLNILSIYNKFIDKSDLTNIARFEVVGKEELEIKTKEYQMPASYFLDITVGLKICRLVGKVNNEYFALQEVNPSVTINDVLKLYIDTMKELGYYGEVFSMDMLNTGSPIVNKPTAIPSSNQFNSNSDTLDKSPVTETHKEEVTPSNLYDLNNLYATATYTTLVPIVLDQDTINRVNKTYADANNPFRVKDFGPVISTGERIVGFLADVNNKFILLEPKDYNLTLHKRFNLLKFRPNVLALLRFISNGKGSRVKFDSPETLEYYCKILEKC